MLQAPFYLPSKPFPSKSSIVFSAQQPFYSQPNYSYIFLFVLILSKFGLPSPDVNKNKGVAERVPVIYLLWCGLSTVFRQLVARWLALPLSLPFLPLTCSQTHQSFIKPRQRNLLTWRALMLISEQHGLFVVFFWDRQLHFLLWRRKIVDGQIN